MKKKIFAIGLMLAIAVLVISCVPVSRVSTIPETLPAPESMPPILLAIGNQTVQAAFNQSGNYSDICLEVSGGSLVTSENITISVVNVTLNAIVSIDPDVIKPKLRPEFSGNDTIKVLP